MALYDDVVIVVKPDSWLTWDTSAYNAALAEPGVDFAHVDEWFRPVGV